MDNLKQLYTTTEGRISRKQWWLGVIILAVANIIVQAVIASALGLWANPQGAAWLSLILFLVVGYPLYCLYLKRRHDKDNSGLDSVIYLALLVVTLLLQALGLAFDPATMQPSMLYSIVGLVMLIYSIYILVVMGFLRGTPGPNQYGPDPLGGTAATAA